MIGLGMASDWKVAPKAATIVVCLEFSADTVLTLLVEGTCVAVLCEVEASA